MNKPFSWDANTGREISVYEAKATEHFNENPQQLMKIFHWFKTDFKVAELSQKEQQSQK